MMLSFNCHHCQSRLTAYVHGELSPYQRRRVLRHITDCEICYAVYVRERDLTQELSNEIPMIGRATRPQLDRVWLAVQADIARPKEDHFRKRYGVVVLAFLLVFFVPWTMGNGQITFAEPPTQPAPHGVAAASHTPTSDSPEITATVVAATHSTTPLTKASLGLQAVPAPRATSAPK